MLKHIVIEQLRPGCVEKLEAAGVALQKALVARGLTPYRAWREAAPESEPAGHFDIGFLGRARDAADTVAVFEADFADRAALEAQLRAVRNDPECVRIMVQAEEYVFGDRTRVLIVESWTPPL